MVERPSRAGTSGIHGTRCGAAAGSRLTTRPHSCAGSAASCPRDEPRLAGADRCTSVLMSASAGSGLGERGDDHRFRRLARSARAKATGVAALCRARNSAKHRRGGRAARGTPDCRWRGRSRPPPPREAGARSRLQGLRLSDSESAQKSCPSGAPSRAAAACMADRPGTMRSGMAAQSAVPRLQGLDHGRRHGEDTRVAARTRRRRCARRRRGRRRGGRGRARRGCRWRGARGRTARAPGRGRARSPQIGRAREHVGGLGREPVRRAGAEPDDGDAAAVHGRLPWPGTRTIAK